jgi:hypothetical protein
LNYWLSAGWWSLQGDFRTSRKCLLYLEDIWVGSWCIEFRLALLVVDSSSYGFLKLMKRDRNVLYDCSSTVVVTSSCCFQLQTSLKLELDYHTSLSLVKWNTEISTHQTPHKSLSIVFFLTSFSLLLIFQNNAVLLLRLISCHLHWFPLPDSSFYIYQFAITSILVQSNQISMQFAFKYNFQLFFSSEILLIEFSSFFCSVLRIKLNLFLYFLSA